MPYYSRGTLHDYLGLKSLSKDYLDAKDVLRMFLDICDAVKYLHQFTPEPLAHRDIKTANVCLSNNFNPILMDLGNILHMLHIFVNNLQTLLGSMSTAKVQLCGSQDAQKLQDLAAERCSMPYRAPELFHVESYCIIDQRTDIWVRNL